MQVIFLDVDGVLNIHSQSYYSLSLRADGSSLWMERHLVHRLNYLIKTTGADVVISSSWRGDMEDLKAQLEKEEFKYWDKVIGATGYKDKYRGDQIQSYLNNHPEITRFVVLEDEPEDVCGAKCSTIAEENVVFVDMENGLSHKDILKAKHILQKETL